jgi:TRAP-type C4-dicarboxylate transport system permease small subunit
MSARRITTSNGTIYVIALVVIVVAFLLLGGWDWIQGSMHGSSSLRLGHLNWLQIIISLAIGFILGLMAGRRR